MPPRPVWRRLPWSLRQRRQWHQPRPPRRRLESLSKRRDMNFAENVRIALRALAANKLRSALTMLGIIIGVGAVVALMAIGTGATASITQQVQGIGSNVVVVFPGKLRRGRAPTSEAAFMYYTDYEALLKNLSGITGIVASYQIPGETVTYGKTSVTPSIVATTPS